jgi:3-oxoacyl-[acyl-carrier-protein] synthase II
VTEPEPSGHSYSKAILNALKEAGISPGDVDLHVPNGLGIPAFDRAELNGLQKAYGDHLASVAMSPIKAQIGSLAAGGGVEAAAAVLGVHHGKIPPAINTRTIINGVKLNVAVEARDAKIGVAVTSVYSLGGQNSALVFRKVG